MNHLSIHRATGSDLDIVRKHCELYHYLKRWPDPRSLPFAYYLQYGDKLRADDGRLWGLVVFKKPQHHQQRGLFGYVGLPTDWQVLDLARVWVHPSLQRKEGAHSLCIFSQMLSLLFRQHGHDRIAQVQADWLEHHPPRYPDAPYHIEVIISYCDLGHHNGKAYRASGFTWNGYSTDRTKEVYFKWLSTPKREWQPNGVLQLPLFIGMPIVHGGT